MTRRLLLALMATTALTAACGGSGSTSSTPTPAATPRTVSFSENEFTIAPATMTLKAGKYVFQAQNGGKFPHDLHIQPQGGTDLASSTVMQAGQSANFQVTLQKGTYAIYCAVDSHRQRGMEGTVTVT
jgi:uncharacterized cupredoxin-like copper-binding protein